MEKNLLTILFLLIFIVISTGCGQNPSANKLELNAKKLQEFYPGDISNVDSIEIVDGSTDRRKVFTNKQQVQEWIGKIKDVLFVPDPNQEDRSGFLFAVSLREGEQNKLFFTPNSLGGHYYIHNEEMLDLIKEFFDEIPVKVSNQSLSEQDATITDSASSQ